MNKSLAPKVVPVPVPLSVPGRFGSKFLVNYGSSVLYGSLHPFQFTTCEVGS